MPTTYPPKAIDGFMVAGGPDAEESNFAYPADLAQDLKIRGYCVNLPGLDLSPRGREDTTSQIVSLIRQRFCVAKELMVRYPVDFMHLTIFYINSLHHFLWNDPLVLRAWKAIDEEIGNLSETRSDLIVMSDHGCMKIKRVFFINTWLEKLGYVKRTKSTNLRFAQIIARVARLLRISHRIAPLLPARVLRRIPTRDNIRQIEDASEDIDWQRTFALATGQGLIYVNRQLVGSEYDNTRQELIRRIEDVRDPITNERICKKAHRREEVYSGPFADSAPDIVAEENHGFHIDGGIGKKEIFGLSRIWQAENEEWGIFLAIGPSFASHKNLGMIRIYDIAPTILHILGLPVPSDIDGRVLAESLRPGSGPAARKAVIGEPLVTEAEKQRIRQVVARLKI